MLIALLKWTVDSQWQTAPLADRSVWNNNSLKKDRKINICEAVVLTTLLLHHFHQRFFHIILNIHWSNFVANIKVLVVAETTSIDTMLLKIQLHQAGHISRMEDHHLPKVTMHGELSAGHHGMRAPLKSSTDSSKKSPHDLLHWPLPVGNASSAQSTGPPLM